MSDYHRPWWLLVNKPAGLVTTVQEESSPGERGFVVHGEPRLQGLAWLTWGPIAALVVIVLLTGLAIGLNVRAQSGMVRFIFIAAYLILPAIAWAAATIVTNRLAAAHLEAERRAEAQDCFIRLDQEHGELCYRISTSGQDERLAFGHIRQVRVTPGFGAGNRQSMRLTLDTDTGAIVLLNESLGTQAQKVDLAREIQRSLNNFTRK